MNRALPRFSQGNGNWYWKKGSDVGYWVLIVGGNLFVVRGISLEGNVLIF